MRNKLKWILVIVAILIVVLVVSIYIFLARYDYNNLKPQITKAVLDATGRELTIGGDIDLHVGLKPALVLSDIKFQNAPWGSRSELVKTRRFEVKVSIFLLLTGHIVISSLSWLNPIFWWRQINLENPTSNLKHK